MSKKPDNKTGRHCLGAPGQCPFLNLYNGSSVCSATASCELSERAVMQAFEWASKPDFKGLKP